MKLSRRQMILAGLGLFISGCAPGSSARNDQRSAWPELAVPDTSRSPGDRPTATPRPPRDTAPDGLDIISRHQWASRGPVTGRVNRMDGVSRITVHHEGWTTFWDSGRGGTADRLEKIRRSHVDHRGWGDIGYHYVIDRAGRIWEARSLQYQGAHVGGHNEHNLGVVLLGNFDEQSPTDRQLDTLTTALRHWMSEHSVPLARVFTHQELTPSACPGRNLQPRVASLRRNGSLG